VAARHLSSRSISTTSTTESGEKDVTQMQARSYATATPFTKAVVDSFKEQLPKPSPAYILDRTPNPNSQYYQSVDGAYACAYVAYAVSDAIFIYPITPSSVLGELSDVWMAQGKKNAFGQVVDVREMQSEAGAAGAVHGALAVGAMSTTYTASQGLLLMIPNIYKIAGELLPCVIHVAAREIAGQALSIFGGHADVMAVRQTGAAILSAFTVQQAHDMALVAHIATLRCSLPFIHFFDGFRTSHEVNKIKLLPYDEIRKLIPDEAVQLHRTRALNPLHPTLRGSNQGPDVFFQNQERINPFYKDVASIVEETMELVGKHIGREYKLYEYFGAPDAENVIVLMGSSTYAACEAADYLMKEKKEKVGVVMVHLFRPFVMEKFVAAFPKSVKRVAVLDRCKEITALGEPLFVDTVAAFARMGRNALIVGGRYGLGSKDFIPEHVLAVFTNLRQSQPKNSFTVGINDDLTNTSLPFWDEPRVDTTPKGTVQCVFWGIGSDGTVGANRSAVKIIGDKTDRMAQAYFSFDAFKSGGVTQSHLRFGPSAITSQYLVTNADYVACHFSEYAKRFRLADNIRDGGAFVLNSRWNTLADWDRELPAALRKKLAQRKAKCYNIDARKICNDAGLGKRINMVMQTVFFKLSNVIPIKEAVHYLKESVAEEYGKKGEKVVEMNQSVIDIVVSGDALKEINYPASWATIADDPPLQLTGNDFVDKVMMPMMLFRGGDLPTSVILPGGQNPVATTQYAKRAIAATVPIWKANNCTQCNYCAFTCPHAVIRPFTLTDEELSKAPKSFETRKAKGDYAGYNYRIQIAPLDCTGCEVCVHTCPDDALEMVDVEKSLELGDIENWDFACTIPERGYLTDRNSVKGSQFQRPLLEFSGACEGCGETPYVKLLTQLFGERMIIANATGCSSIWGGTSSFTPYAKNSKGHGPAWGNSLFEDNAEYGFGMAVATAQRRSKLTQLVEKALEKKAGDAQLQKLLGQWLRDRNNGDKCAKYIDQLTESLMAQKQSDALIAQIADLADILPNISQWIIGGDGWANDIGYGGLDHVLASAQNLNILVLDTEMYSNTGGQMSKSSHLASVSKFALGGKKTQKKALGEMAMTYGNVYVASISLGNMAHCVKAMVEAETYEGPSLLLAYAPCIEQGLRAGMAKMVQECEAAVDCGYWPLYRYDPRLEDQGKNPFQLDSKRLKTEVLDFLKKENRFINLDKNNPKQAPMLKKKLSDSIKGRMNRYKRQAESHKTTAAAAEGPRVTILYGSETGNSEALSRQLAGDFERRDYSVTVQALDDVDPNELPTMGFVVLLLSTCGQGAFPKNSQLFWAELQKPKDQGWLKDLKYCIYGLGDSSYYFFNYTAKVVDARIAELGGKRIVPTLFGDDGDEDKFETKYNEWIPTVWQALGTKTPEAKLFDPTITVNYTPDATPSEWIPSHATPVQTKSGAVRITPKDYQRNFVTIEWKTDLPYRIGDSLGVFPENNKDVVTEFLKGYGLDPKAVVTIDNRGTRELPEVITVLDIFSKVVDLLGKPNRRFYQNLSFFATDAAEKERLMKMGQGEGDYSKILAETYHYADILKMFKSAKPPLQYLIEMIPNLKPRYYSISSSPKHTPGEVHSLVLIDTWTTPAGRFRTGLTCSMLEKLQAGQIVNGCIHPTAMEFPDSDERPKVMAGIGSGLAPFVAFLRERSWKRKQGMKVGQCVLYFGNQYEKKEYLLKEELQGYVKEGLLHLRTAFSRDDPKKKVYVQDLVRLDPELLYDLLFKQKGYVYVCGNRNMPKPVQKSIQYCLEKGGKMTEKQAEDYVVEMYTTGRFNIESW